MCQIYYDDDEPTLSKERKEWAGKQATDEYALLQH